jgi:hypothetical protein
MGKLSGSNYKHEESTTDDKCPVCHDYHTMKCATPGCSAAGTITDSTHHACMGEVRWYCHTHYYQGDYPHDGKRLQRELIGNPVKAAFAEQLAAERKRQREMGPSAYRERAMKALLGHIGGVTSEPEPAPANARSRVVSHEVEVW